jgi:hypothetical protein
MFDRTCLIDFIQGYWYLQTWFFLLVPCLKLKTDHVQNKFMHLYFELAPFVDDNMILLYRQGMLLMEKVELMISH